MISAEQMRSKLIADSALFQDCVSGVPRFDFCINCYATASNGAIPDVMVTLAAPNKGTAVLRKDVAHPLFVFCHYNAILSCRSERKESVYGGLV